MLGDIANLVRGTNEVTLEIGKDKGLGKKYLIKIGKLYGSTVTRRNFETPFPNTCLQIMLQATQNSEDPLDPRRLFVSSFDTTGFSTVYALDTYNSRYYTYLAIGY